MAKFYVTTPIYYVNAEPHLGHAYTTVAADILARWNRMKGNEVFFLTGTDEHGQKIQDAAKGAGLAPHEFVDRLVPKFKEAWKVLNISNDDFIRTTEKRHEEAVAKIFKRIWDNGDVYKGEYEGWYCIPDESFWTELQLKNGKCPSCGREVKLLKEETYYFRLSKYQDKLLEFYEENPDFISPELRKNEILNRVKEGLKDLSITRTTVKWAIPFPFDKNHYFYVWVEALMNYLTALGYPDGKKFKKFWPVDVEPLGKEINWFHSVIFPALLFSAGIKPPKMIFAHGWWTVEGQKMSKSVGNVIDPVKMARKYSADAFRYFLFREVPFGADGDFSEDALKARLNNELVANYGNLFYRVTSFIEKNFGAVPEPKELGDAERNLQNKLNKTFEEVEKFMEETRLTDALRVIMELSGETNRYFQEKEPWKNIKEDKGSVATTLYFAINVVKAISVLLYPFTPEKSEKALEALNVKTPKWGEAAEFTIEPNHKINAEILYKKVD